MEKLGSYKIIRYLGDDSANASRQAWDDSSSRTVVLRPVGVKLGSDEALVEQYAKEQKRLTLHDQYHAARFFGLEELDSQRFFVREYVEGRSLAEMLAEEPIGRLQFYNLAIQIMEGLKVAHEFGVVHGRLTANNVIVSERGQVRLTEAGLPLTAGENLKLPFRAPELRAGTKATEAGDLFSAGVLFYQMLTGQKPWTDGEVENVDWLLNFESIAGRLIDRDSRLLIEKMISTNPIHRGINAEEIQTSLKVILSMTESAAAYESASSSPAPTRWSARSWMAISALSMLLIIFWLVITTVVHQ